MIISCRCMARSPPPSTQDQHSLRLRPACATGWLTQSKLINVHIRIRCAGVLRWSKTVAAESRGDKGLEDTGVWARHPGTYVRLALANELDGPLRDMKGAASSAAAMGANEALRWVTLIAVVGLTSGQALSCTAPSDGYKFSDATRSCDSASPAIVDASE
jgi:hypothetical protein